MRAKEFDISNPVEELADKLPKLKKTNYDTIDELMQHISKRHKLTGQKLHDMFVKKYGHTPDTWVKKIKQRNEEVSRRGFLKGMGATAAGAAASGAKAGGIGIGAIIPVNTDSDPPLPRKVKWAWEYFNPEGLTNDDKNNIVKLINLLYFSRMAPEDWRDSQNGRIIGNVTPSEIYKKCYELLIFINDSFRDLDFAKVMNEQKSKIENLYKNNPEQFKKLQEFFFSKWETIVVMGDLIKRRLTPADKIPFGQKIALAIKRNIVYSGPTQVSNSAEVEIKCAPDGTIVSFKLVKSSGVEEWDQAVLKAVQRTEQLPRNENGRVHPLLLVSFNPKEVVKEENLAEEQEVETDEVKQINDFIEWSMKTLHVKNKPKFTLSKDTEQAQKGHHTGVHSGDQIWVYIGNRNMIDILRTVFHELVHQRQDELGMIKNGDSYPGSPIEAMADMLAGKYIKIYGKQHPEIFQ